MNIAAEKEALRRELGRRWAEIWPESGAPERPPLFPEAGRAAARLARLPEYRRARVVAFMPDPVLLQARVNALRQGKSLIVATPGLKKGLVRLVPGQVPVPQMSRMLRGGTLTQAGSVLRFPAARLARVDLVVGAAVAADRVGGVLGDGRGMLDLFWALLTALGAAGEHTPLAVLVHDAQVLEKEIAQDPWDAAAQLVVAPESLARTGAGARLPRGLEALPEPLASLPVVRGVLETISS